MADSLTPLTRQHVEQMLEHLQGLHKQAEKDVRDRETDLRRAQNVRDKVKTEIGIWEKTLAAFKEAGIN